MFVETDRAYRDGALIILSDKRFKPCGNPFFISSISNASVSDQDKETYICCTDLREEPREVHHFATLLGYGACAVNPYLALQGIKKLIDENMLQKDYYAAVEGAILHGIVRSHLRWVFH